jgi:hypothetical protein
MVRRPISRRRLHYVACGSLAVAALANACAASSDSSDGKLIENSLSTGEGPTSTGTQMGSTGTGGSSSTASSGGMGGMCSEDPCKLVAPQCGCDSDEACALVDGERLCVGAGTTGPNELCSGNDCAPGSQCLSVAGASICYQHCTMDAECTAPGGLCVVHIGDGKGGVYPETLCSTNCNPISNAGCPAGSRCTFGLDEGPPERYYTLCVGVGGGQQGDGCNSPDDCAAGLDCLTVNAQTLCYTFCDLDSPVCPGSTECLINFDPPADVGGIEYGACL